MPTAFVANAPRLLGPRHKVRSPARHRAQPEIPWRCDPTSSSNRRARLIVLSQKVAVEFSKNQVVSEIHAQRRAAMNLEASMDSASRFVAFVEELTSVIGHADRARPLRDYCSGLLVSEGRRSVEPIAAVTAPAEVSVQHQKLLHF